MTKTDKMPYEFGIDDLLAIDGIDEGIAERLIASGVSNSFVLATASPTDLKNIPTNTARNLIYNAQIYCIGKIPIVNGEKFRQEKEERNILTTGSKGLDRILGGRGFETQRVYELYGPEGTGKSNFLHQLMCTAFLPPDQGGLGAGTIYIDTDGTFSITRVRQMAPRWGIDPDEITRHIIKAAPPTSDVLLFICVERVEKLVRENNIRLICLDSIATCFRAEYGAERRLLPERNQKVAQIIQGLKLAAQAVDGVLILTNQVEENYLGWGRPWMRWGTLWQQDSHVHLMIRVKNPAAGLRQVKVEHAPDLPPESCEIYLGEEGFTDHNPAHQKKK